MIGYEYDKREELEQIKDNKYRNLKCDLENKKKFSENFNQERER